MVPLGSGRGPQPGGLRYVLGVPHRRRLPAMAAVVVVLAGCGGDEAGAPSAGPTSAPSVAPGPSSTAGPAAVTAPPTPAPEAVPDALRFRATGLDGSEIVGADYAGRDVALWFWAPW